jgi:hypothetical protein
MIVIQLLIDNNHITWRIFKALRALNKPIKALIISKMDQILPRLFVAKCLPSNISIIKLAAKYKVQLSPSLALEYIDWPYMYMNMANEVTEVFGENVEVMIKKYYQPTDLHKVDRIVSMLIWALCNNKAMYNQLSAIWPSLVRALARYKLFATSIDIGDVTKTELAIGVINIIQVNKDYILANLHNPIVYRLFETEDQYLAHGDKLGIICRYVLDNTIPYVEQYMIDNGFNDMLLFYKWMHE